MTADDLRALVQRLRREYGDRDMVVDAAADELESLLARAEAAEADHARESESLMQAIEQVAAERARAEAAEAECARLRQLILWALGEVGEFPMWPDTVAIKGSPKYWWRKDLRARYDAAIDRAIAEGKQ